MSMRVLLSRNGQSMETCLDALVLVFVDIDQRRNNIVHKGRPEKKKQLSNYPQMEDPFVQWHREIHSYINQITNSKYFPCDYDCYSNFNSLNLIADDPVQ